VRSLPIYPRPPVLALEGVEELDLDPACTRCDLNEGINTVCVGADGEPGGLLVVGESPGRTEDDLGRPFVGNSGKLLRSWIARVWKGPVAIDNAVRCYPKGRELKDKHFEACRGFLAQTAAEVKPSRILVLGGWSAYAVTGRAVPPLSSRRGFTHLVSGRYGKAPIPVFFLLHPAAALRNRFLRAWFESDLTWALTAKVPLAMPLAAAASVVVDRADAELAVAALGRAPWVSFDVETAGILYDRSFRLLCVSFCPAGSNDVFVWDAEALANPETLAPLAAYLRDPSCAKTGTNVKFDQIALDLTLGIHVAGVRGDVRLSRKLLEPEADADLDTMSELVGLGGIKEEQQTEMAPLVAKVKKALMTEKRLAKNAAEDAELVAAGKPPKKRQKVRPDTQTALDYLHSLDRTMPDLAPVIRDPDAHWKSWAYALAPTEVLLRYNARDSLATTRLVEWVEPQLAKEPEINRVRKLLVEPAALAIRQVERWGVPVDRGAIVTFDRHLDGKLAEVKKRLDAHGPTVDWDSPKQVGELLFGTLGLKPSDKHVTKTGANSTSEDALANLKGKHPVIEAILDWRGYSKLKGTYAAGMLPHCRPDGRIHSSILLDGARSGRTSSSKPNLQNIPRPADSIEGKMARDCFAAGPEFTFIQLDYSQLELRVAAMLSKDPDMRAIFDEGVDYHQRTAELISQIAWGIPASAVQKPHRSMAKSVNFGILYGKTARTLAKEWGVSEAKAQTVIDAIMGRFRKLDTWCKDRRVEAARTGVSWTWWDGQKARRRPMWRIADSDGGTSSRAENGAVNTPIQGTASDFCIASLVSCVDWIESEGLHNDVQLVLPVHDSLLFLVRKELLPMVASTAHEIMTSWNSDGVPLEVDVEIGSRWGSLQKAA
jgi:uracil-DNA glycosylase family 4